MIARLGPAKAVTVTYLIPAFGVLWGFLFLKEPISARMLGGAAIVLIGTALASGLMSGGR